MFMYFNIYDLRSCLKDWSYDLLLSHKLLFPYLYCWFDLVGFLSITVSRLLCWRDEAGWPAVISTGQHGLAISTSVCNASCARL